MAQDATGTPTPLGIPKYNTAADVPSGKGFNAAMDAIDTIITARSLPVGVTNGPVYWNGTSWTSAKLTGAQLDPNAVIPAGHMMPSALSAAPAGWLIADGSAVSRTTYSVLFAAIGTFYGTGDGSTTFNLPNAKGRSIYGIDAAVPEFDTRGETGGARTHTLSALESGLRSHLHAITDPGHAHSTTDSGGGGLPIGYIGGGSGPINVIGEAGYNNGFVGISTNTTGISIQNVAALAAQDAHNNMPPYIALHWMIKT